jgi:hypothetical protein
LAVCGVVRDDIDTRADAVDDRRGGRNSAAFAERGNIAREILAVAKLTRIERRNAWPQ